MTDFRALCAELLDWAEVTAAHYIQLPAVMLRARAALAEPEPKGPTDEELSDLWSWAAGQDQGPWLTQQHCFARAVLARWGTPAPHPVLVSERLPGPEDCDAKGRCWWGEPQIGDSHDATWNLCTQDEAEEYCTWGTKYGWLPAHAIPLPTAND